MIALLVRLITSMCVLADAADPSHDHWSLGYETGRIARSVATGHGFGNPFDIPTGPSAWLAPVYPLILAGLFKLFGVYSVGSAAAILSFNSLVAALTVVPVYFVARKMFGQTTATWAAWAWAFFPYSIYFAANWIWDTTLSVLILTTLLWLTLVLDEPKPFSLWITYGFLWGLAALTNPTLLAAFPLLLGWLVYRMHGQRRPWVWQTALTGFLCVLSMAPWLARNVHVFHQPVFVKDNFWMEVKVGNSVRQFHWWNDDAHPSHNSAELKKMATIGEVAFLAEKKQESLDFIRNHPGLYLWLCLRRFVYIWFGFWSPGLDYLTQEPMDPVNMIFCTTLTLLALLGIRGGIRAGNQRVFPVTVTLFASQIAFCLTHPFASYRHTADPGLVLLGTYAALPALSLAWTEWKRREQFVRWARVAFPALDPSGNVSRPEKPLTRPTILTNPIAEFETELEPAVMTVDAVGEGD